MNCANEILYYRSVCPAILNNSLSQPVTYTSWENFNVKRSQCERFRGENSQVSREINKEITCSFVK